MDEIYFPPHVIASLDEVPEEWREHYLPYKKTGPKAFIMESRMWSEVVVPAKEQVGQLRADIRKLQEEGPRRIENERAAAKRERVERGLSDALATAGVPKGLVAGAVALLIDRHAYEVERTYADDGWVVMADVGGSLHSAADVITTFLENDEGRGYRGTPHAPAGDNRFTSWVEDMKRSR